MINEKSRIREVFLNPVGNDVLRKILLQMGIPERAIKNPAVGALKLSSVKRLAAKKFGEGFFDTFITLMNQSPPMLPKTRRETSEAWWKEAVFYQIYPRSFARGGEGDGGGDLCGITGKLDYLKDLGVDALWLSPIYDSPDDDNGYDIRDYNKIDEKYGTMEDFDELLSEVHKRGMRLIMDLVVNHTSDEHEWFKSAVGDEASPYRDYYFLREKPNNWTSFFGGSAWNDYGGTWGLHLFSKKQMDLNWKNKALREDIYAMVRRWLEKGVDGFRLDVINYISKAEGLPDGNEAIGKLMGFTGIEHYFHGPRLHDYLKELRSEAFSRFHAFSVGETPGIGVETGRLLTDESRGELDMMFSFDHLENPGRGKFDLYDYDLNYYKKYIIDWEKNFGNYSWMSLFYDNHDNPRMVSKVDRSHRHREKLAMLLGLIQMTLRGAPFIYQGQELGAINKSFSSPNDFEDIESINMYRELCAKMPQREAFRRVAAGSRDNARAFMEWDNTDKNIVLSFYKSVLAIRKKNRALIYGEIGFFDEKKKDILVFERELGGEKYRVIANLSASMLEYGSFSSKSLLISNYKGETPSLRPYEGRLYKI